MPLSKLPRSLLLPVLAYSSLLASSIMASAQTPSAARAHTPGQSALPIATTSITVVSEPVPLDSLAGPFTSLDRDALLATGARDAAELLRFVPGVHYSQSGAKGSLSTVTIRGGKPNFTLVLINGVAANDIGDQLGGAFNFSTLDLDAVERVDIYRGPLSAVYGSEAIGGVINIILRSPAEEPVIHFNVEAGQYGYSRASGGVAHNVNSVDFAASGSFERIGEQVLKDGSTLGTAALAAEKVFAAHKVLHSFARWNRLADSSFPVSSGGPLYALSRLAEINRADQIATGAQFYHQVDPRWLYTIRGDVFSRVASDNSPAIFDKVTPGKSYVPSSISDTRFLRSEALTMQQITPRPWVDTYTTLALRQESGTNLGSLGGHLPASYWLSRFTSNLSEDANLHNHRGALTAGASLETTGSYGTVITPRAGGSLTLAGYTLHLSWAKGFKLPSFYSLGNPLIGNPKLQPETSDGVDAGISRNFPTTRTHVAVSYFDSRYHHLIDFSPSIFKLVNRNTAFARGSDVELNQQVRSLSLGAAVTYVDAGLEATSERLRDVPRWSEELHARLVLPRQWTAQIQTEWVGRRFDYQVPVPQLATVPRYTTTNFEVTHRISERTSSFVRIENAFNSKYEEFVGFPSPGIYASAGITYSRARSSH
jgi:vitamin B12 transporter